RPQIPRRKVGTYANISRRVAGGTKYRASIALCNLRLQARPRSCLGAAQDDLELLAKLRRDVSNASGPFEDRVRCALSPEASSDRLAVARCGITLQVATSALCRRVLLSPAYDLRALDAALGAWGRLRAAQCSGLPK
ncbi:unnamed protein product, partial [Effrenium voratum]